MSAAERIDDALYGPEPPPERPAYPLGYLCLDCDCRGAWAFALYPLERRCWQCGSTNTEPR